MEHLLLKLLPIFLVYFCSFTSQINCQCGETKSTLDVTRTESTSKQESFLSVKNIFEQKTALKSGDLMECEVTKIETFETNNNDINVFTQSATTIGGYIFYPASKDKKCFSYQVRTKVFPHILLSSTPTVVTSEKLEVILEYNGKSVIRTKDTKLVSEISMTGIVNNIELRGFWIRWLDDYLLEFGRDTDNYPLLSYRLPYKISPNFIGILSYTNSAEWILHKDPKCGAYNVTEELQTVSICKVVSQLAKNVILQKSQEHILHQIKMQRDIFKISKFRSREILLEYQQLIKKHFRNAEANQNNIYAADNEVYCPLKSTTFNEITKQYFQFLEELQIELSVYVRSTEKHGVNDIENSGHSCVCDSLLN